MTTILQSTVISAGTITGDSVRNRLGDDLGKIEDIMLDVTDARIAYAVLSFGGFLGMGDKYFAIPWEALELDTANKCFILDADKERLEKAPGFEKDKWPNFADRSWGTSIYKYYERTPYWKS